MNSGPSPLILNGQDRREEVSGLVLNETYRRAGLVLAPHFHEHANIVLTVEGSFIARGAARRLIFAYGMSMILAGVMAGLGCPKKK